MKNFHSVPDLWGVGQILHSVDGHSWAAIDSPTTNTLNGLFSQIQEAFVLVVPPAPVNGLGGISINTIESQ